MPNVYSYVSGEQNCQNAHIARYHAKIQFLTRSPVRERDSCLPLKAMDFPKSHVLKRLVKKSEEGSTKIEKIMRAMQAKPTTTIPPLSAHIVLLA